MKFLAILFFAGLALAIPTNTQSFHGGIPIWGAGPTYAHEAPWCWNPLSPYPRETVEEATHNWNYFAAAGHFDFRFTDNGDCAGPQENNICPAPYGNGTSDGKVTVSYVAFDGPEYAHTCVNTSGTAIVEADVVINTNHAISEEYDEFLRIVTVQFGYALGLHDPCSINGCQGNTAQCSDERTIMCYYSEPDVSDGYSNLPRENDIGGFEYLYAFCPNGLSNSDKETTPNGPDLAGDDETNPISDTVSNSCDSDDDNDGIPDAMELDPFNCNGFVSDPLLVDSDQDGLSDGWECTHGSNPINSSSTSYTAATSIDSDGDHIPDGAELKGGTNPLSADSDGDGCGDLVETVSVDGNRRLTDTDRIFIARVAYDIYPYNKIQELKADLNHNGVADQADKIFADRAVLLWNPGPC